MSTLNIFWLILACIAVTQGCEKCPRGIRIFNCLIDPCQGKTCDNATCRSNYCGGCNRLWYSPGGYDVTKRCEL